MRKNKNIISSHTGLKFSIILENDKENGGYVARCPAIKGCWSQGDTKEEALKNIREAIVGCLKSLNAKAEREAKRRKYLVQKVAVI